MRAWTPFVGLATLAAFFAHQGPKWSVPATHSHQLFWILFGYILTATWKSYRSSVEPSTETELGKLTMASGLLLSSLVLLFVISARSSSLMSHVLAPVESRLPTTPSMISVAMVLACMVVGARFRFNTLRLACFGVLLSTAASFLSKIASLSILLPTQILIVLPIAQLCFSQIRHMQAEDTATQALAA